MLLLAVICACFRQREAYPEIRALKETVLRYDTYFPRSKRIGSGKFRAMSLIKTSN
jgi:hypothetical protein